MTQLINLANNTVYTDSEFRSLHKDTSFPASINYAEFGYAVVFPAPQPEHDLVTQRTQAIAPVLTVKGTWEQRWEVVDVYTDYTDEQGVLRTKAAQEATAVAERFAVAEAVRIAGLWQAAHDYEYAQISGSAIGLITMGVIKATPKCLAVQNWIKSIWTTYYLRKENGSNDIDFDMVGPCPHSMPELMTELGV